MVKRTTGCALFFKMTWCLYLHFADGMLVFILCPKQSYSCVLSVELCILSIDKEALITKIILGHISTLIYYS